MPRRICVVVGSRANYASIKTAMKAISEHPSLELVLILVASTLLERYGEVATLIESDGFEVSTKLFTLIEGETPATMVKSTGLGLIELSTAFQDIDPDIVLTVGDRFETIATSIAAAYMNIPVAHTMGGEVSGSIDESIRHATTKLAHIHFPATKKAKERIILLGENPSMVFHVGCPRIDLALNATEGPLSEEVMKQGVGSAVDPRLPFIMLAQHPVTSEYAEAETQIEETLVAVEMIGLPTIVLWPNADAGSDGTARGIRKWREAGRGSRMHFFKNIPAEDYLRLIAHASCLVGNSSSGIREGAFLGTPVVNVGNRQLGRERGQNVIDVDHDRDSIRKAIETQLDLGRYPTSTLYGEGKAGEQIAEVLSDVQDLTTQKKLAY